MVAPYLIDMRKSRTNAIRVVRIDLILKLPSRGRERLWILLKPLGRQDQPSDGIETQVQSGEMQSTDGSRQVNTIVAMMSVDAMLLSIGEAEL